MNSEIITENAAQRILLLLMRLRMDEFRRQLQELAQRRRKIATDAVEASVIPDGEHGKKTA